MNFLTVPKKQLYHVDGRRNMLLSGEKTKKAGDMIEISE